MVQNAHKPVDIGHVARLISLFNKFDHDILTAFIDFFTRNFTHCTVNWIIQGGMV
jgi:hypothetical protein